MNRRSFIKSAAVLTALSPTLAPACPACLENKPTTGLYHVNCFVWSYEQSTHYRYRDLWTDPEPIFHNLDSAVDFIDDHKNIWDLNIVNVSYDISYYPTDKKDNCVYRVGSFNYNTAGVTQWVDAAPHKRHDYDSF